MELRFQDKLIEAGCDEAGRGCLAGGLFAAAVILPDGFSHPLLNDSKKMTARNRKIMREIIEKEALAWSVVEVSAERIDQINVLNASFEGMSKAVEGLSLKPELLLIDGPLFRTTLEIDYKCIVKGDSLYANIAAASVLAKTYRDDYMDALSKEFPAYEWSKNKGYPTKAHREVLAQNGISPYHRKSFAGVKEK